jgi:hypothetical protein
MGLIPNLGIGNGIEIYLLEFEEPAVTGLGSLGLRVLVFYYCFIIVLLLFSYCLPTIFTVLPLFLLFYYCIVSVAMHYI